MRTIASAAAAITLVLLGWLGLSGPAAAQSRTPPAGSELADEPPIDQTPEQFFALPDDQRRTYRQQDEDDDEADLPPRRRHRN